MSRGKVLLLVLAMGGVLVAARVAMQRSTPSSAASVQPASAAIPSVRPTISASDPTWCGKPNLAGGRLGDDATCGKLSLTGSAPDCRFWAECREERFEIDCSQGRCRCDGANGATVPYEPAFCALDATSPQRSLHAILEAAARACRWRERRD